MAISSQNSTQDDDVILQMVQASTQAFQQARAAGHTLVFVRNNQLIRVDATGQEEILKQLPPRTEVHNRTKIAKP